MCRRILMQVFGGVGVGCPITNCWLDFGCDPDPGILTEFLPLREMGQFDEFCEISCSLDGGSRGSHYILSYETRASRLLSAPRLRSTAASILRRVCRDCNCHVTRRATRNARTFATGLDWPLCHCAMAHAPPPPFDEHRRPLAPSKFFDMCVTEKNSIIAVVPCLRPWSWWNAVNKVHF